MARSVRSLPESSWRLAGVAGWAALIIALRSLTSDPEPVQDVHPRAAKWPLAVLALGGVLTIAWIAFLLWAGFQVVSWILG